MLVSSFLSPLRLLFSVTSSSPKNNVKVWLGFLPGIVALIVAQTITVSGPKILEAVIQQVSAGAASTFVVALIFGYGAAVASGRALGELTDYLLIRQANVLQQLLRERLISAIVTFPNDSISPSRLMAVWQRSSQAFDSILNAAVFQIVPKLATLAAVTAIVAVSYGGGAVLPALIGGGIYAMWLKYAFRGVAAAVDRQNDAESDLTADLHGFFAAHRQVRIDGLNPRLLERAYDLSRLELDANVRLTAWQSLWMAGNAVIIGATLATSLSFSFWIGSADAAGLIALSFYVVMMFEPIESLSEAVRTVLIEGRRAEAAASIMATVEEAAGELDHPNWKRLHFRDITIVDTDGQPLFHPISFVLERGEKVLIQAASGTGKTSFANSVFFGDRKLRGVIEIESADGSLRRLEAVGKLGSFLTQENAIVNRSIGDNVRWSREGGELLQCVKQCLGDHLNARLEDSPCADSELTSMLSGGQKRRVSVARLMQQESDFAILDEPVTGLDAESAHDIVNLLMQRTSTSMIFLLHSAPQDNEFSQIIELISCRRSYRTPSQNNDDDLDDTRLAHLLDD